MPLIGFHAGHELHAPSKLLKLVQAAQQAGFHGAMCSDHFHPWSERQSHSGFAWSWLGVALQATRLSYGVVCAPGYRYHPAVIAQAAATLAEMFPGRFWLALGSGEYLNEHITGESWPAKKQRNERLKECAEIIRALWRGETVNHDGHIRVRNAKLYSLPPQPPLIIGAAITPETCEWLGSWADGLITVGSQTDGLQKNIQAFRRGGGLGKKLILQSSVSFADTEDEALDAAAHRWIHAGLEPTQLADLEMPSDFDAATKNVDPQSLREKLRISSSIEQHRAWLQSDIDLGFDEIYLSHIGEDSQRFIESFSPLIAQYQ